MAKTFREIATSLGATYVGPLKADGGAFGAAGLAKILHDRLQPKRGQSSGATIDPHRLYHHRAVPMSDSTLKKLATLVKRINRVSERRKSKNDVAALLLEKAIDRELAQA